MKRRVVIYISCCFFVLGIIISSFLPRKYLFFDQYYLAAAASFLVLAIFFWSRKTARAYALWGLFLFLGIWRFSVSLPADSPDKIFHYNGKKTEFIGLVSSEPVKKSKNQKLEIRVLAAGDLDVSGKVLLFAPAYPEYAFGDVLKINCKLETPAMIQDFDYGRYLAAQGIYSTCNFPKISLRDDKDLNPRSLEKKKSLRRFSWLIGGVYQVRNKLSATIDDGMAEPEAGLLKAFILNEPTVPDDLNTSFRQSGLAHIVAISGSHISLVIAIIFFCLLFFGLNRRHAFWFCVPIIIFYVVMVGSPASAVRSGIMGFLVLLAMYFGRLNRLDHSLMLAATIMLLANPLLAIADAGFQLSFLAVLGMIYLYPVFDKWLARITTFLQPTLSAQGGHPSSAFTKALAHKRERIIKVVCQTFALTLAAQVFTAPILIFGFHQISLIAPFANLFALWAAPFIMIFAFIAMGLSLIFPAGAIYFFLPAGLLVKYLISVAEIFASFPFASWKF